MKLWCKGLEIILESSDTYLVQNLEMECKESNSLSELVPTIQGIIMNPKAHELVRKLA